MEYKIIHTAVANEKDKYDRTEHSAQIGDNISISIWEGKDVINGNYVPWLSAKIYIANTCIYDIRNFSSIEEAKANAEQFLENICNDILHSFLSNNTK